MSTIPTFTNPCVVADASAASSVFVMGVAEPGRLEIHRINLANLNKPSAILTSKFDNSTFFRPNAEHFCDVFEGSKPGYIFQQFGTPTTTVEVDPEGKISRFYVNPDVRVSARLYGPSGSIPSHNWYLTMVDKPFTETNSSYQAYEQTNTDDVTDHVENKFNVALIEDPLLLAGSNEASVSTPAQGFVAVFDKTGAKGISYTTTNNLSPAPLIELSAATVIDMGGVTLTKDAYPINMGGTAYIMDKCSAGTTVLYSIGPKTPHILVTVPVKGDAPPFYPGRTGAPLGKSQVILFGGLKDGMPTTDFFVYDTITTSWTGSNWSATHSGDNNGSKPNPGDASNPNGVGGTSSDERKNSSAVGAIAGGIAAAMAMLAILCFFLYRRRKRSQAQPVDPTTSTPTSGAQSARPSLSPQAITSISTEPKSPQLHPGLQLQDDYTQYRMPTVEPGQPIYLVAPEQTEAAMPHSFHSLYDPQQRQPNIYMPPLITPALFVSENPSSSASPSPTLYSTPLNANGAASSGSAGSTRPSTPNAPHTLPTTILSTAASHVPYGNPQYIPTTLLPGSLDTRA